MRRQLRIAEMVALLEADGWTRIRSLRAHQQLRHDSKAGVVTLVGQPGDALPRELVRGGFRHAGVPWAAGAVR